MKLDFCLELDGDSWVEGSLQLLAYEFMYVLSVRNPTAWIDTILQQSLNQQIHKIRPAYLTPTKAAFLYLALIHPE